MDARAANPAVQTATLAVWVACIDAAARRWMPRGVDCLVGHSFGGLASAFATTSPSWSREAAVDARRLVLLSTPSGMDDVIASYARQSSCSVAEVEAIRAGVEAVLKGPVSLGSLESVAPALPPLLAFHDPRDEIAPYETLARALARGANATLVAAPEATHHGIVALRSVLRRVAAFATG